MDGFGRQTIHLGAFASLPKLIRTIWGLSEQDLPLGTVCQGSFLRVADSISEIGPLGPPATVAHEPPPTWAAYIVIYNVTRILGKSALNFIRDFIGKLALIFINLWSGGLILECQSRRIKSRR